MKKLICAIAFGALAYPMSTDAMAQGASRDITLSASVAAFCRINPGSGYVTNPAAVAAAPISVDANTGIISTTPINVSIGDIRCNKAANVTLTSANGALITSPPAAKDGAFENYISYTAAITLPTSVTLAANSTSGTTASLNATSVAASSGASNNSNVQVTITPTGPLAAPLVPGAYVDTVTVLISPAP
jgi:hypothetical protein